MFKKIRSALYGIIGIVIILSFFAIPISAFFVTNIKISEYYFNTPLFFTAILFIGLCFIVTFPASWKQSDKKQGSQLKRIPTLFIFFTIAIITGFLGIYQPLKSRYIAVFTNEYLQINQPFVINTKADTDYYMEIDTKYTSQGTPIKIKVSNAVWSDEFSTLIGQTIGRIPKIGGTALVYLPFKFPANETYYMYISGTNGLDTVYSVRLFEKR